MSATLTLCKSSSRCVKRGERMGDRTEERVYKSLWHVGIAAVGIYEYRHHKSLFSKILSAGLIAFHIDGAIADALDVPPLSRRILESVLPDDCNPKDRDR